MRTYLISLISFGAGLCVTSTFSDSLHLPKSTTSSTTPFTKIVNETTGYKIIRFDTQNEDHLFIRETIETAVTEAIENFNKSNSAIRGLRRINEASRYFEDFLLTKIDSFEEFSCSVPLTRSGKSQRSGYPDLQITHLTSNTIVYLDPKLFEESSIHSGLRTFYFQPKTRTSKINADALHLLIGIAHDGNDGAWTFTNSHLIDLSTLDVRLKTEFHASNRILYSKSRNINSRIKNANE